MNLEIHMLQNFAPSNLNRDDTGSPKDCEFGGYRRARISSQCQKRAMRLEFKRRELLPPDAIGNRTKRLADQISRRLVDSGRDLESSKRVATNVISGIGLGLDGDDTEYLLFIGNREIDAIGNICLQHWDALAALTTGDGKQSKKEAKGAIPKDIANDLKTTLDGRRAADVALFGRMLADLPDRNRDAASQVAHAISTNRLENEFDFYTAVDDLKPREEDTGAGMLGTIEFNSSCYYRYANVDLDQLIENLGQDEELTRSTVRAFLDAAVTAVPTGKQNSFAAQNPPSLIFCVLRDYGLWSLANAFLSPARPNRDGDLVSNSIAKLDSYWNGLAGMYGETEITRMVAAVHPGHADKLATLATSNAGSVASVIDTVMNTIQFNGSAR